jgi:hypothetical protein
MARMEAIEHNDLIADGYTQIAVKHKVDTRRLVDQASDIVLSPTALKIPQTLGYVRCGRSSRPT